MIQYHAHLVQGSEEWLQARLGLLTASEMKHIITPAKLTYAANDKERSHLYELLAQRITGYVEPQYVSDDMLRGMVDEIEARQLYSEHYAEVQEAGFITNNKWGFTLGYSPDGLVGDDGLLECKSRRQKYQVETILRWEVPSEHIFQVQTGLLVSERPWCDFISYSAGLPMVVLRAYPVAEMHEAIINAATIFEEKLSVMHRQYSCRCCNEHSKLIPTERKVVSDEITV